MLWLANIEYDLTSSSQVPKEWWRWWAEYEDGDWRMWEYIGKKRYYILYQTLEGNLYSQKACTLSFCGWIPFSASTSVHYHPQTVSIMSTILSPLEHSKLCRHLSLLLVSSWINTESVLVKLLSTISFQPMSSIATFQAQSPVSFT